jgi:very-short-patch-repair endonuclease
LANLQRGKGIGCGCHNKTELKLYEWLLKQFPTARLTPQYRGPKTTSGGQTHFDFHLTFPDGFEVIIELDGAQHFWSNLRFYTDDGCERDLLKEEWAVAKGLSVVRVLQEDVWEDKLGWQGWLTKSIENARTGEARPITPDAPEYRSANSAYIQLRSRS